MKALLLFFFLFVFAICSDYRRPSKSQIKCFIREIGMVETKKLLESLRKYHRTNGKATLLDYILQKRLDLKAVSDKCLLKINNRIRRRLDKLDEAFNQALNQKLVKYYINSILRDKKVKDAFIYHLNNNNKEGLRACTKFLVNEKLCTRIMKMLAKTIEDKK